MKAATRIMTKISIRHSVKCTQIRSKHALQRNMSDSKVWTTLMLKKRRNN